METAIFVNNILEEAEEKELRQSGIHIAEIIRQECKKWGISTEELTRGTNWRRVSEARTAIAHRSTEDIGLSGAEIACHLGVNTSSINRAIARGESINQRGISNAL